MCFFVVDGMQDLGFFGRKLPKYQFSNKTVIVFQYLRPELQPLRPWSLVMWVLLSATQYFQIASIV